MYSILYIQHSIFFFFFKCKQLYTFNIHNFQIMYAIKYIQRTHFSNNVNSFVHLVYTTFQRKYIIWFIQSTYFLKMYIILYLQNTQFSNEVRNFEYSTYTSFNECTQSYTFNYTIFKELTQLRKFNISIFF